ncbi:MarR family winged helix-turn-helix transcriptional regulator [Pediococcus parvulus]|uniref:MarR family winged helix-turn-helix transcriptional regulator n=1 Tax=Pediococcus parvulus TaxID=54062 RepID=UPI003756817F
MENHLGVNHQLHVLANMSSRRFSEEFLNNDITGKQGGILHYLLWNAGKREIYQRDVEKNFSIRRSSVTSLLKKLEDKQYITRESVEGDARLKQIVLTPRALKLRKSVIQGSYDFEDKLLQNVSAADIEVWQKVTKQMIANLSEEKIGSGKSC